MKSKRITSERFGNIEVTDKGFFGELKDLKNGFTIYVDISEEIKGEKNYSEISEFLNDYEKLDVLAKEYIFQALEREEEVVKFYYDFHKEELPGELAERLNNEELTKENLVAHTQLCSIWFSLDKEDLIATFDYKLLKEYCDEILAVRFNQEKTIFDLVHES